MIGFFSIFLSVYALDVVTKTFVRHYMPLGSEIQLFPFFSLIHVQNTGIAFGLFQNRNFIFIVVGILLSAVLIWMAHESKGKNKFSTLIFGIILSGAWGNLTDRLMFGHVTDFLDFYVGTHHWPAFNVADSAICIGAGLLLLQNLCGSSFPRKRESRF